METRHYTIIFCLTAALFVLLCVNRTKQDISAIKHLSNPENASQSLPGIARTVSRLVNVPPAPLTYSTTTTDALGINKPFNPITGMTVTPPTNRVDSLVGVRHFLPYGHRTKLFDLRAEAGKRVPVPFIRGFENDEARIIRTGVENQNAADALENYRKPVSNYKEFRGSRHPVNVQPPKKELGVLNVRRLIAGYGDIGVLDKRVDEVNGSRIRSVDMRRYSGLANQSEPGTLLALGRS